MLWLMGYSLRKKLVEAIFCWGLRSKNSNSKKRVSRTHRANDRAVDDDVRKASRHTPQTHMVTTHPRPASNTRALTSHDSPLDAKISLWLFSHESALLWNIPSSIPTKEWIHLFSGVQVAVYGSQSLLQDVFYLKRARDGSSPSFYF